MVYWASCLSELDFEELMSVYEESNRRSGACYYLQESAGMQEFLAMRDFEDYLRNVFFRQKGAFYCILVENDAYISAARIEPYEDGYLISALETKPIYRRKGHGRKLINEAIRGCIDRNCLPLYSHVSNQNVSSLNLHLQCGFCIHKHFARYIDGSVHADSKTLIYKK